MKLVDRLLSVGLGACALAIAARFVPLPAPHGEPVAATVSHAGCAELYQVGSVRSAAANSIRFAVGSTSTHSRPDAILLWGGLIPRSR